jgi:hypothetical protein
MRQHCTERACEPDFSILLNIFLLEGEPAQLGQKKNTRPVPTRGRVSSRLRLHPSASSPARLYPFSMPRLDWNILISGGRGLYYFEIECAYRMHFRTVAKQGNLGRFSWYPKSEGIWNENSPLAPNQPYRFSSRLTRAFSVNEFFFLATVNIHLWHSINRIEFRAG